MKNTLFGKNINTQLNEILKYITDELGIDVYLNSYVLNGKIKYCCTFHKIRNKNFKIYHWPKYRSNGRTISEAIYKTYKKYENHKPNIFICSSAYCLFQALTIPTKKYLSNIVIVSSHNIVDEELLYKSYKIDFLIKRDDKLDRKEYNSIQKIYSQRAKNIFGVICE